MQYYQARRQEAIIGDNPRERLFVFDDDALQTTMMAIMVRWMIHKTKWVTKNLHFLRKVSWDPL